MPQIREQEELDKWAHRSRRMRCGSCMWFVAKSSDNPTTPGNTLGRCRKHAPTLGGWVAVFESDWCGDHKLDENKAG